MAEAERFKAAGTGPLSMGGNNGAPQLGQPMAVPQAADPTQSAPVPRMDAHPANQIRMGAGQPGATQAVPGAPRAFQPAPTPVQAPPVKLTQPTGALAAAPAPALAAAPQPQAVQPGPSPMTPGGAQRPFMNRQVPVPAQPQSQGGEMVFKVTQMGTAPDGTPLMAEFDAVFPAGTSLNGGPTVRRV